MACPQGAGVTRRAVSNEHEEKPHMKSRPLLKDLLKELDSIVTWQLLMINLGVEKFENDKIEKNIPNDIEQQKQAAFDKWLRNKPDDAYWKDVIDALYEMEEITLASSLAKKYNWIDPRVSVNNSFSSAASSNARITTKKIDMQCQQYLPPLTRGLEYYVLEDKSVQPITESSAAARIGNLSRLLQTTRPNSLADFFKSIENSSSKGDFKVGLEARFGQLYWKINPEKALSASLTHREWIRSKLLRKTAFNTQVTEADIGRLFAGRELLDKEMVTRMTLKFVVEGKDEGIYSAVIAVYEGGDVFYLDAVYRKQAFENRAKLNIGLPGHKYDFRISECTECILLAEHQKSKPYQIARTITNSLCRLPDRRLHVILRGSSPNNESSWKVQYIRQRVQRQYKWKPEKKWILAQYDVDVFDSEKNVTVKVNSAPLNEGVDIPEFDYSRKEVELWGQKIFPKNIDDTHPSRDKYYYMEGIEGVRLPGGELREPCNWTTEELLRDFDEFLGDAFKIAHILNGSPY